MRAKSLVEPYFGGADRVFAYGSGLFSAHYNLGKWSTPGSSSTLLDFMVVVPELEEFHRKQMSLFPQHYGHRLLALGPKKVAKLQRDTPGKTLHLPYAKLVRKWFPFFILLE